MLVNFYIKKRKNREIILEKFFKFSGGDILSLNYRLKGLGYSFIGLCLGVKKKKMIDISTSFILRNVFNKISTEFYSTIYSLCRLNFKLLDYARKKFNYRKSKLYYLRNKVNSENIVRIV